MQMKTKKGHLSKEGRGEEKQRIGEEEKEEEDKK